MLTNISKFNNWLQSSLRLLLTVFVCGLLFISSAYPAQAATRKADQGVVDLNEIQKKTDDVGRSNPLSLDEIIEESQKGLNEVQGGADRNKMIDRKDASNATTVEDKAANILDKITGKK
jgi:hypothetical protein